MNKIPMNLEQTVQYLLDEVQKLKAGIAPGELIPGPQGVPGPEGPAPVVTISNSTGNWVIDGVDTGKPSRGKQGEKGNTGMQGVPGVGIATMLSIDSTDYTPTVTDDGEYQDVESSADIKYSDGGEEHSTQVDFNVKVPKTNLADYRTASDQDVIDDSKLDKVTTTSSQAQAYVKRADGTQGLITIDSTYWSANTIALRGSDANIVVGNTPTHANHATPKKYVDTFKLYVHEGTVSIDGFYNRYKILSKKATAFTNPETDFPERGNLFTLRTGSKMLYNLWYDDSDRTWYYTNSTSIDTEDSSYNVTIVTDIVYAL